MKELKVDVAIVGAGAVGSALAAKLLQDCPALDICLVEASSKVKSFVDHSGPNGAVAEQAQSGFYDPKVMALSAASIELFEDLGLWDSIVQTRACAYQQMQVWDAENTGQLSFGADDMHRPYLGYIVENSVLVNSFNSLFQQASQQQNKFNLVRPASVVNIKLGAAHQELELNSGQKILAQLVIAADGAQSSLRTLAGFETRQWSYQQNAIVTTVETELSHQHTAWQVFRNSGPLAFLPLQDVNKRHYCSIVWSLDTDKAKQMMAMNDGEFAQALESYFERRLGAIKYLDKRYMVPLKQSHSKDYAQAGLILVGDAAHSIHPLAGQGANLGFYDVKVLAKEIQRACHYQLPLSHPSIGKRYQRQRKSENLGAMATMEGLKRVFALSSPWLNTYRGVGLNWVNKNNWLKQQLVKAAAGPVDTDTSMGKNW